MTKSEEPCIPLPLVAAKPDSAPDLPPTWPHFCLGCGGRDVFPVPIGDPVCLTCNPQVKRAVGL